jgi:hypothetical protein
MSPRSNNTCNANNNNTQQFYFTSLHLTETITRTFHLYFQNARLFLSLAAVVVLPKVLISCILLWTQDVSSMTDNDDYWEEENHVRDLVLVSLAACILFLVLGVAAHAAMIRAVTEIYIGQHQEEASVLVSLKRLLCEGLCKVGSILCYWMVLFLGLLTFGVVSGIVLLIAMLIVGLLLALIVGQDAATVIVIVMLTLCRIALSVAIVYVMLGVFAVTPIIVIEGHGWQRAMERSWELTSERRLFIFGAKFLKSIAVWLPFTLYVIIAVLVIGPTNIATATGAVLIYALPFMIIFPIYSM